MKFRRFLARHFPCSRLRPIVGAVGARRKPIFWCRDRPIPGYRGPFEEHVLISVREGTVTFERGEEFITANPNDTVLISRGEAGQLTFIPDRDTHGITAEITTFDERTIAKTLRTDAALESAAITDAPDWQTAFHCSALEPLVDRCFVSGADRIACAISFAVNAYYCWQLPRIFRAHFYLPRWQLCIFLDRFAAFSEGAKRAAREYKGGVKQLRRDCLFYIGAKPEAILRRRRCELAYAWLRCGHKSEDVAKTLGYSSTWDFESEFAGVLKKRCRDVEKMPLLNHAEPEELIEALRPCWWKGRELTLGDIPKEQIFGSIMDQCLEDRCIAHEPYLLQFREESRQRRADFTEDLRAKAADFFAMKTTGADVIVPFFKSATNSSQAA